MKFVAKVDLWFKVLALGMVACAVIFAINTVQSTPLVVGAVVFGLVGAFCLAIWFGTYYALEKTGLHICCGFCTNWRIPYQQIVNATPSRCVLSSPAPSLDRVEVVYTNGRSRQSVWVSPRERERFIRELLERTP